MIPKAQEGAEANHITKIMKNMITMIRTILMVTTFTILKTKSKNLIDPSPHNGFLPTPFQLPLHSNFLWLWISLSRPIPTNGMQAWCNIHSITVCRSIGRALCSTFSALGGRPITACCRSLHIWRQAVFRMLWFEHFIVMILFLYNKLEHNWALPL